MPFDLLRRRQLRTTSSTGCSLQLAAETKLEIMKSKRQQQQQCFFSENLTPTHPLRNANNVEPYIFVTLFQGNPTSSHPLLRYLTLEWPHTSLSTHYLFSLVVSLRECATSKPLIWTEKLTSRYDRFVTKVTVLLFLGMVESVVCFKIIFLLLCYVH